MEQYGRGTPDDWVERNVYGAHPYWGPTLMLFISVALFGVIGAAIWARADDLDPVLGRRLRQRHRPLGRLPQFRECRHVAQPDPVGFLDRR